MQLTLPELLLHVYQLPPEVSCTFTVPAVVGAIVKVTESRLVGVVAFRP